MEYLMRSVLLALGLLHAANASYITLWSNQA